MKTFQNKRYFWTSLCLYTEKESNGSKCNETMCLMRLFNLFWVYELLFYFFFIFFLFCGTVCAIIQLKTVIWKDNEASKLNIISVLIPKILICFLVILVKKYEIMNIYVNNLHKEKSNNPLHIIHFSYHPSPWEYCLLKSLSLKK